MKKFFFCLSILLFIGTANAITIFQDNFTDGDYSANPTWDVNLGTWTVEDGRLKGGSFDGGSIHSSVVMPAGFDYNLTFQINQINTAQSPTFAWFVDGNNVNSFLGYRFIGRSDGIRIRKEDGGAGAELYNGGNITNVAHTYTILHTKDGNISLYVDGDYNGSVSSLETTYTSGNRIMLATTNGATDANWDNITITRNVDINFIDQNISGSITFSNYGEYDAILYTNTLNYLVQYDCNSGRNGVVQRRINETNDINHTLTCDGNPHDFNANYQHTNNSLYNIKLYSYDTNFGTPYLFADENFQSDLNAPTIDFNHTPGSGGFGATISSITLNLTCSDPISPKVNYDINNTGTSTSVANAQYDANSLQSFSASVVAGENNFGAACRDLAGNISTDTNTATIYTACFNFVDEQDGTDWTPTDQNISFNNLTATSYQTASKYDFISQSTNKRCFTSTINDTIRFDINYSNGNNIFKEFNLSLVTDLGLGTSDLDVCLATPQDLYEQLFISSQQRNINLQNSISHCYALIDYTKYAYEDALSHRAYTIVQPYTLRTDVDGNTVILSLINGAVATSINMDVLVFKIAPANINIQPDEISVSLYVPSPSIRDSNTLQIYYWNLQENNQSALIKIYDGTTLIWSYNETSTPNQFTLYFDHTTIDINADVLKIEVVKTLTDGTSETITKYFTLQGSAAPFPVEFAAIAAFFIFFFGLTLVSYRLALGWWGLMLSLITIGILSFAPGAWYIIFLQAIMLIIGVFIFLVYKDENAAVT